MSVPSAASAMPNSSPIKGKIGAMIMIWLEAENTSSQSVKMIRYCEGGSGGETTESGVRFDAEAGPETECKSLAIRPLPKEW